MGGFRYKRPNLTKWKAKLDELKAEQVDALWNLRHFGGIGAEVFTYCKATAATPEELVVLYEGGFVDFHAWHDYDDERGAEELGAVTIELIESEFYQSRPIRVGLTRGGFYTLSHLSPVQLAKRFKGKREGYGIDVLYRVGALDKDSRKKPKDIAPELQPELLGGRDAMTYLDSNATALFGVPKNLGLVKSVTRKNYSGRWLTPKGIEVAELLIKMHGS